MKYFYKIKNFLFKNKLDAFWIQEIPIKRVENRLDIFKPYLLEKKVIHIGCTDYPIFNPKYNLHLQISTFCKELQGMDVDKEGLKILESHFSGKYYDSFSQINEEFDLILVPETIEHVDNVKEFLQEIDLLNSSKLIITAPNCFNNFFKHRVINNFFIEAVHPDHNCWYSPYTLKNVIEKFSNFRVKEVYLTNKDLSVVCYCERK